MTRYLLFPLHLRSFCSQMIDVDVCLSIITSVRHQCVYLIYYISIIVLTVGAVSSNTCIPEYLYFSSPCGVNNLNMNNVDYLVCLCSPPLLVFVLLMNSIDPFLSGTVRYAHSRAYPHSTVLWTDIYILLVVCRQSSVFPNVAATAAGIYCRYGLQTNQ